MFALSVWNVHELNQTPILIEISRLKGRNKKSFVEVTFMQAIYKTRNTGTGNGMRGMLGNGIILTFRGMFQKIPGNVQKDSGECSKRFRGMFNKIPGNVQEDSGEC